MIESDGELRDRQLKEEYVAWLVTNLELTRPIVSKELYKFNKFVLQVDEGQGKVPLAKVHWDMGKFIDESKKKNKLLLIPRGHLKSTFVTVGRTCQAICNNPMVRILIVNATYSLATSFLKEIKYNLQNSEWIKMYYGDLASDPLEWSRNTIMLNRARISKERGLQPKGKEPTVTAMGLESNMTSQHYDIIIF